MAQHGTEMFGGRAGRDDRDPENLSKRVHSGVRATGDDHGLVSLLLGLEGALDVFRGGQGAVVIGLAGIETAPGRIPFKTEDIDPGAGSGNGPQDLLPAGELARKLSGTGRRQQIGNPFPFSIMSHLVNLLSNEFLVFPLEGSFSYHIGVSLVKRMSDFGNVLDLVSVIGKGYLKKVSHNFN